MRLLIALLSFVSLLACRESGTASAKTDNSGLPADFEAFYELFHGDSAFQVEHVAWPLDGNIRVNDEGERFDARWTQADWELHQPLDLGDTYLRELDVSDPEMVVERIKTTNGAYLIERRFAKLGSTWMLIYYRVADIG